MEKEGVKAANSYMSQCTDSDISLPDHPGIPVPRCGQLLQDLFPQLQKLSNNTACLKPLESVNYERPCVLAGTGGPLY